MTTPTSFDHILQVTNDLDLRETGGGHGTKGIEYQKHWSILRMFQLKEEGAEDFLFLFESIQDVAILDSCEFPTSLCVHQVKKKDRNEWTWANLTGLHAPGQKKAKPLESIKTSPLGKLYASVQAALGSEQIKATGKFISNAGCDLPLGDGTNMATSLPRALNSLSADHLKLLSEGLAVFHAAGGTIADPSLIHIEKVALHPDDPKSGLVGKVHDFLLNESPRHAGQARALVDALVAKISPLGAKTDSVSSFEELRRERGFSKAEFQQALGALEHIPDSLEYLERCVTQLTTEGMPFVLTRQIVAEASAFYRHQVMGSLSEEDLKLQADCGVWLSSHPLQATLRPYIEEGVESLSQVHSNIKKANIAAQLILRTLHYEWP